MAMTKWYEEASMHICDVRPRKDQHQRGVDSNYSAFKIRKNSAQFLLDGHFYVA
jgi:hypothetical protein